MKNFKRRLKSLIALTLGCSMLIGSITASADVVDAPKELGEDSILSDDFERLKEEAAQYAATVGTEELFERTYASARSTDSISVTLNVGGDVKYNSYSTKDYSLSDGTTAFCLEPSQKSPSAGGYTASRSSDQLLSAMMYYGYGGPGYMTPDRGLYYLIDDALHPYVYVLTHMALSYIFDGCSDDSDAFKGTNAGTVSGLKNIVSLIDSYKWDVPSNYKAYTFSTGSGNQAMGFGYYEPEGSLNLVKTSANSTITDGNSCYSLSGAVYGVFSDGACTSQVGTLTTDDSGNSNTVDLIEGDYWVKEQTAPKGYALDPTVYPVHVTSGQTATVQATDKPTNDPVRIDLQKVDKDTGERAQGTASLAGAQFTIKYYDGYYDKTTLPEEATRTWVIETKERVANGKKIYSTVLDEAYKVSGDEIYLQDGVSVLPLGTITIEETKAPDGYLLEGAYLQVAGSGEKIEGLYVAQITQEGDIARLNGGNTFTMSDSAIHGGVKIQKYDYDTKTTTPQGEATLQGAEIELINMSSGPVSVNGTSYATGQTVLTLTTDASGTVQTGAYTLPVGDYKWKETKAPTGYQLSGVVEGTFSITENGVIVDLTAADKGVQDKVIRGGVKIQKRDYETGDNHPLGGATLEGAEYVIVNKSRNPVIVNGVSYANGENVMTLVSDADGLATTTADALPRGDYALVETKAPTGYLLAGVVVQNFSITENGVIVDLTAVDNSIRDQVKRGDFELRKIDSETQDSMAGVEFSITNLSTGETHNFTTDENGYYSSESSWNLHSNNTNGGGAEDGLWFGQTTGGAMAAVNDNLGALPWGIYSIDEIEGINNAGKEMFHGLLYIRRNGTTIDLGNIENYGEEPEITITTKAKDTASDSQFAQPAESMEIVDEVSLEGLVPGREYTIKGVLMDKETKQPLLIEEEEVTAEYTFTADKVVDTVEMTFAFDGSALAGKEVVVFETIYYRGRETASHESLKDKNQTVYFPVIGTSLLDNVTESHLASASEEMEFTDIVEYSGFMPGKEYTMKGILMDKETGEALLVDGEEVTAEQTFTPETEEGEISLTFFFDGSTLAGKTIVAYETCYYEDQEITAHHDLEDVDQTVQIPVIGTELTDNVTGSHMAQSEKEMQLTDTVSYKNLIPGKEYVMKGILMDKATGKALLIGGKEVTAEKTFTPETETGTVELTFTFNGSTLGGKTVVAFETCYYEELEIAAHHDIKDVDQTVQIPAIGTELTDNVTGSHMAQSAEEMQLTDVVSYENLMPGKEYTMNGILMDKETGKALLVDGKELTAETTFTPKKETGTVELTFTFDGSSLAGKTIVAYETCYHEEKEIAVHHDIEDVDQTVQIPAIGTELTDNITETHMAQFAEEMQFTDTVSYKNLIPGKEYVMKGILMEKATGEALLIDGKEITAETTFTPEKETGTVELTFTFDGSSLAGKTIVAYETCYYEEQEIAVHHDIEDMDQTVQIPIIGTELTDNVTGTHEAQAAKEMQLTDVVSYENLIPGKEYVMKGILMDKTTGEALLIGGKEVTAETTFTPEKETGTVALTFTFDGSTLGEKTVVAFETCYYGEKEIAVHHDIEDANQSVTIANPPVPETPKTDDNTPLHLWFGILLAGIAAVGVFALKKRKGNKKEQ